MKVSQLSTHAHLRCTRKKSEPDTFFVDDENKENTFSAHSQVFH